MPRDRASEAAQARLKHEFEVHHQFEVEGLVRVIELVEDDGHLALVYEDPGGQSLARLIKTGPPPLETTLEIARQLAVTLAALHQQGYTHRDLRPCHILVGSSADSVIDFRGSISPSESVVKHSLASQDYRLAAPRIVTIGLMGLGGSAQLPQEWPGVYLADSGNDPSYLSPEQTGRINRKVDYRTDFYSLGVILFQMLTGRPPFVADDPAALVHAHLAKPPPAPSQIAPDVPQPVSAIVLKLLAKAAEDRYQSGYGIARDLDRCLHGWQTQGAIETFTLGEQDVPVRLELPQRLYGRRTELERLLQHVTAAARGTPQVLWVAGHPGVGKTALSQELRGPIFLHHGFFASGKYDEFERSTPYRAIRQAVSSLVQRLLGESQEKLERYRTQWQEGLGTNLGVMVDFVPDLNIILGETPPPAKLEPMAAKHRLHWCVYQFLELLASEDHPLVLFLDDLQWSDSADLELLQDMLGRGLKHFLFLGAYRDHQIDAHHPLLETLAALRAQGIPVEVLNLRPLDSDDIGHWIADAFRTDPATTAALAERVYQKTAGNPFFVRLFLLSLYEAKILTFSPPAGWQWDLTAVSAREATENVIDLIAQRVAQLGETTRQVVALAATLGRRFSVADLAALAQRPAPTVEPWLIEACRAQILVKYDGDYGFSHDRIQESAYALIPDAERPHLHLRMARLLAQRHTAETDTPPVFEMVSHLNRAAGLLIEPAEREEAVHLQLSAGRTAKAAAAFPAAFNYLANGLALLGPEPWRQHYALALALHGEAAEAAYLSADFPTAERLATRIHVHARMPIERIPAFET